MTIRSALILAILIGTAAAQDRVLKEGKPKDVGMSASRLDLAAGLLEEETKSGRVLAASIFVARKGVVVLHRGSGRISPEANGPAAGADTVYMLASITKPVTVAALMLLVERGQVCLSDPLQKYLPEFKGPDREKVRVQDILTHTSGLPDMLPENAELRRAHAPLSEFVKHTMTTPLLYVPRTSFTYQSMGTLLAGEIVERITKERLRDFEKREFFDALGMKGSSLGLGGRPIAELAFCQGAPAHTAGDDDQKRFGANTPYWRDMGHPWGGMHGSARDLGIFLQMFLNGGAYDGRRIFGLPTVTAMITDQNRGIDAPYGLGWALKRSKAANWFGDLASDRTFGHVGATGTVAWADPARDLVCVILTTRPGSEDGGSLLKRVSNAVQAAIEE